MDIAVDTDTLGQLKSSKARTVLDTIDSLRSLGIGNIVNLPQIIVVGDQSSGKSSVLEAISHIRFPVRGGICTRFTTELILRRAPEARAEIEIRFDDKGRPPHIFQRTGFSQDDLPDIIEKAKGLMGIGAGSDRGFSRDVLRLRIEGPDMCPLTLVDLPGFFHSETADQSQQGKQTVDRIAEEYMKRENTIMLAVVSANQGLANQIVLQATKLHDPKRQRTLGVITKPDLVTPRSTNEATFMQLAKNQEPMHKLALGWHVLRNRAEEEDQLSDRDTAEDRFFSQGAWGSIYENNRGIRCLRKKLSEVLFEHIQKCIPGVIEDIISSLVERQAELDFLGRSRSTPEEMRAYLVELAEKYQRLAQAGVDGRYNDPFFGDLEDEDQKLRALLRNFNNAFVHTMLTKGMSQRILESDNPETSETEISTHLHLFMEKYPYEFKDPEQITSKALNTQLTQMASINQGKEFPGTPNKDLVIQLFQKQSKPWRDIARFHIDQVMTAVRAFVDDLFFYLTSANDLTTEAIVRTYADPFFEEKEALLGLKLEELIRPYAQGYGLPPGNEFRFKLSKRMIGRLAGKIAKVVLRDEETEDTKITRKMISQAVESADDFTDEFGTEQVVDMMEAYYETSLGTFIENVINLAIESCLVCDVASIFTPTLVNSMNEERLIELASESPEVRSKRVQMQKEVQTLTEGFKLVSRERHRPRTTLRATESANKPQQGSSTPSSTIGNPTSYPAVTGTENVKNAGSVFDNANLVKSSNIFGGFNHKPPFTGTNPSHGSVSGGLFGNRNPSTSTSTDTSSSSSFEQKPLFPSGGLSSNPNSSTSGEASNSSATSSSIISRSNSDGTSTFSTPLKPQYTATPFNIVPSPTAATPGSQNLSLLSGSTSMLSPPR
ncbi:P-loop containing nucleoside triphosphate hydrolase protein [Stachybotrys elegans]|uniref:P-loop containing nucleoside triphosphate hydrolase protein n=1 Tax=Stachybotrys elegans TaxID=80388 RepID=A0A8K0SHG7_9HYPO|nr:P-loop containing nucleoside triphosphate hydrolase protein [Stachybotrys elegans]